MDKAESLHAMAAFKEAAQEMFPPALKCRFDTPRQTHRERAFGAAGWAVGGIHFLLRVLRKGEQGDEDLDQRCGKESAREACFHVCWHPAQHLLLSPCFHVLLASCTAPASASVLEYASCPPLC
eukprot:1161112-Pelagomonas_calceolata.AAC.6